MEHNIPIADTESARWYHHLDMSLAGSLIAFVMEVCFHDKIFIPHSGGASFGLIVLLIINIAATPIVMAIIALICAVIPIQRTRKNCIFMCMIACILTILGLFIAYPVRR
ncbi:MULTISPECIES: hypothetical protein [Enterobacteriaceae]|uniref:hypothetical protein n=1 Tax=Enterobacteriaceae TaxID=543 RepID=UPI0015DCBA34|nr:MULTISPECIES: hypothetical protein [unclassified Klebsiella]BBR59897.1 hypothetical protein WP4W18E05_32650 [Klebsiella sp. WP4-W18-ESBL-05]BBS90769.1 hypothetical protein WP7S18C02_13840 [Klebsiella sp. WP7-S18-CRE-02]BBS95792.1 hypothetical protein WP7S18C03_13850 [Klebsiella sp. WP7-S18-CRE-03]BBT00822.1 hypothetical protein WP7S18E04_13840 [Klebsiella sp. WP7-S18-ESBL-04]